MRRFACFGGAPTARLASSSCLGTHFCDGVVPARPHDGIDGPDSDDGASTPRGDDDLDGELLSPLEASRGWPREPETWGRRSVISPHRALVAAPDDDTAPGSDRGKSHGSPGAPTRALPPERRSSSDEDTPADGATRSVGSDLTRSSSSSSEEDDDAVTPLKLTTPTKSCLRPQSSCSSLDSESEVEAFEETQKSLRRAEDPRRVRFRDKTLDAVVTIPNLEDYGWRARRDCYWQPEEYAQMVSISASHGFQAVSRHRRASSRSDEVAGGLGFDFGPFRTVSVMSSDSIGPRRREAASGWSGRCSRRAGGPSSPVNRDGVSGWSASPKLD